MTCAVGDFLVLPLFFDDNRIASQSTTAPQKRQQTFSEYCSPFLVVMMISSSVAVSPFVPPGCPLKNTSAVVEPLLISATGVRLGLLAGFLGVLFFFCALEYFLGAAWSSTRGWSELILAQEAQIRIKLTCALQCLLCYTSDVQPFAATAIRALYYQFVRVLRRIVDTYLP